MAIDVADVKAQFGSYYIANESNMKRLRSMLYQPSETCEHFQERPTEDTQYRSALATLDRIVQPFQKAYTPISTIKFEPNKFDLFKLKVDMEESPDELEATYLGFLASLPEADRKDWLFVRWLVEKHVLPKIDEDIELNECFKGEFAAPAAGVAGAVSTAMDGIRKVIRGYNTAGRLNLGNGPIVLGAVPADPAAFVTYVESFVDAINPIFRNKIDNIYMSIENQIKYRRGKRAKYNAYYQQAVDLDRIEDFPHIKVVGLRSHSAANTNLIWATLPENRIRPTKKAQLMKSMKIESLKRLVYLMTDWWMACNFEVPEFVFTNDQDLAVV